MSDSDDDMPLANLSKKREREEDSDEEFTLDDSVKSEKKEKKHKKHKKDKHKHKKHKKDKKEKHHKSEKKEKIQPKPKAKPRAPAAATREIKMITKMERYEQAMKAFKWWEHEELPAGVQWKSLEQNGVSFTPDYEPHNVKLYYDGKPVDLTPEQEEVATFYAAMPVDGPQLGNPKTAKVFNANFFFDFKKYLGKGHKIQKFEKCDFARIRQHLDREKMIRKAATIEEKTDKKATDEALVFKHGFALVDGNMQKLANFRMEPPSLFRGRGEHPKTGKVKTRTLPEMVTLNVGPDACPPKCPLPGHTFAAIVHKPDVTWLAQWQENVLAQNKYVQLAAGSSFKGKSDRNKYGKAIKLLHSIDKIRKDYTKNLKSKDLQSKQIATAMWIIDILALRVGGEKGEDEADTVGCCSLRVEHFTDNDDPDKYEMDLEFLGKDSMRFMQTINFAQYNDVGKKVYANIKAFIGKKKRHEDVFDSLTPTILNSHLSSIMPGLSAKVFRTYNASYTLEKELPEEEELDGMSVADKVVAYNAANRKVAILCNHQKTVSKGAMEGIEAMQDLYESMKEQRADLVKMKSRILAGKELKKLKKEDDLQERAKAAVEKGKTMTANATSADEKIAATKAKEEANELRKQAVKAAKEVAHLFTRQPSAEQVQKRVEAWDNKIEKLALTIRNKDENKEVALGTSKINYMDPRISVAWCKRNEVPIDKIFAKALRDKFPWAMAVPPDWTFE